MDQTSLKKAKHLTALLAKNERQARGTAMRASQLSILLACVICAGCTQPITPDRNAGENIQLQQRVVEKDRKIAELEQHSTELREQNTRLQTKLAEHESGTYEKEEQQRLLDERKAALDSREQNLIDREVTAENHLSQRRAEMSSELKSREEAVTKRELEMSSKEEDFYDKTNMTMEEVGEAREIKEQYENMRSERDAANATAEEWLKFVWYMSIALGVSMIACVSLLLVTLSKHISAQRELKYRREVANLLGTAIKVQLPPEQGRLVVDAMNQLTRIEPPKHIQKSA